MHTTCNTWPGLFAGSGGLTCRPVQPGAGGAGGCVGRVLPGSALCWPVAGAGAQPGPGHAARCPSMSSQEGWGSSGLGVQGEGTANSCPVDGNSQVSHGPTESEATGAARWAGEQQFHTPPSTPIWTGSGWPLWPVVALCPPHVGSQAVQGLALPPGTTAGGACCAWAPCSQVHPVDSEGSRWTPDMVRRPFFLQLTW